jgi:hypothetical protein
LHGGVVGRRQARCQNPHVLSEVAEECILIAIRRGLYREHGSARPSLHQVGGDTLVEGNLTGPTEG